MEITNRTGIEKTVLNGSQFLIYRPLLLIRFLHFAHRMMSHLSCGLAGGNGMDSGIAGWESMGMGFKFQIGMGMGWEWE